MSDDLKKQAALAALDEIRSGMVVGLGTGSTATHFIRGLGEKVRTGMKVVAIPTSEESRRLAEEVGIPLTTFKVHLDIDVTVDGADEVSPHLDLIKGLGGALVREKMAYYAARPEYLQRTFDRSRMYLYHIVEELEKRGMPTELALLPMVESAFNPMAYSRAHASGIWQFVPGTGKRFELRQNWWYDGRRDIVDSTNAALDYLQYLYEMYGDWQLALASYNWGENAVARAVEKNRRAGKPTDYALLTMPVETLDRMLQSVEACAPVLELLRAD